MKIHLRYYLLLPAIWAGMTAVAQTSGQNYIVTTVPFQAVSSYTALNDSTASANANTTIQYFDGLGRLSETVQKDITPQGADLVTGVMYDAYGRDFLHWLPAVISGNNGNFTSNYPTQASSSNGNDANPYSRTDYEPSPLNRVTGQYGPGADWYSNGKKVTTAYLTNGPSDVKLFTVTGNTLNGSGYYAAATLYGLQTTDEDGKTVEVFTDKLGRKVLSRVDGSTDTYYVYDDLNNLRYVLPPIAADSLGGSGNYSYAESNGVLGRYGYIYHYDGRNRCVMKKLPGCDSICMVYDHADRLVASQDGNQRKKGIWTVNRYDKFNRLVYSFITTGTTSGIRITLEGNATSETWDGNAATGGYTLMGATSSGALPIKTLLTVNYYDNYGYLKLLDGTTQGQLGPANQSGYTAPDTVHVKTMLTGTRVYHLDNPAKYETTAIYYDKYGHVVQTRATNHLGGYDLVYNNVDFTGKSTQTLKTHGINGTTASVSEVYAYTYDKAQRLLTTTHQLNGGTKVILANNSYDPLGRLSSKQHQNGAETISYTYNVRSWLTSINDGSWQEQVYYDNDPSQPYYNGDIARSTWTYNGITKGYVYTYDGLNRLTQANYGEGSALTTNQHRQDEDFTYDKMGNVTSIYRKNQGSVIDNVTLHYTGNQLKSGTDAAGTSTIYGISEYTDDADSTTEYTYDANGNLTADLDKNIVTIRYNVLNLPDTIQFGNGRQIINSYDAGGHKLTTQYYTPIGTVIVTQGNIHSGYTTANSVLRLDDYCGRYLYENGTSASNHPLTKILTPEGYIDMSTSGYPYCYFKQDHLGSNREVTSYAGTTGTVVQQTEYYPSGTAYVEGTGAGVQPFKFTGKELITMHGLNWQDYGARYLDNVVMQWTSVDPLCEKYYDISPYAYCSDDPVKNVDPDGRKFDLSDLTKEQQKAYQESVTVQKKDNELFTTMYNQLENSDRTYKVSIGKTATENDHQVDAQFVENKDGIGGTITFKSNNISLSSAGAREELFHAYQSDNRSDYAAGSFNFEFEAKVAVSAMGALSGGTSSMLYKGMESFSNEVILNKYGDNVTPITPTQITSPSFLIDYYSAANSYAVYNQTHNIGNSNYKTYTKVAPYGLIKLILQTYEKKQ